MNLYDAIDYYNVYGYNIVSIKDFDMIEATVFMSKEIET